MTAPDPVALVEPTSALSRAPIPAHLLAVALLTIESDTVVTVGERRIHAENLAVMAAGLIQSQAARIAELEAGLKPFAAWAISFDGDAVEYPAPDTICLAIRHNPSHKTKLTVAHLRQARSLLSEGEGA
ncbi:hypothetical protein [Brevundimonas sp. NIBR11]|uniref:hypothetical protein n=1 Tax=Brevundimonas sp. NIBR11 TaxID=3015999 RepID=UPI0022F119C1|nr:hypothetical protein [Brevundimonas sp. NIBR11]WGM31451.1 hypothetical protein KKHFBJBL_01698 [Brevundimonas sp. NIBR11]